MSGQPAQLQLEDTLTKCGCLLNRTSGSRMYKFIVRMFSALVNYQAVICELLVTKVDVSHVCLSSVHIVGRLYGGTAGYRGPISDKQMT